MGKYDAYSVDYEQSHAGGHQGYHGSPQQIDHLAETMSVDGSSRYHKHESHDHAAAGHAGHVSSVHARKAGTFTIPCHHIRIGDLVILQHRPCQIIRITTSAQTGQHRYLGVDLFTKQLHEEPCVVSHPSPSVVLHSLLGPVFKQYRLIDIRDDGKLVAMTETGEIKQGLRVVDQGHLWSRLKEAFGRGSGSVRVLVISDHGKELAVDYKIVHLAHKL
ncbi:translation protein SH3-like domain-containing protein [Geopyxis carbonaria]|nr:translation protein SH3-like domain-containing protein [Geopyxis carbonaria]